MIEDIKYNFRPPACFLNIKIETPSYFKEIKYLLKLEMKHEDLNIQSEMCNLFNISDQLMTNKIYANISKVIQKYPNLSKHGFLSPTVS